MSDEHDTKANTTVENVDITPDSDGGVLKTILRQGTGDSTPLTGDEVVVHYVGTLLDGTKFDSSRDRDSYFKFKLGKGSVIKAWDLGVATMKKGEICKLTCRGDYAYGEAGSPPKIPPNATLIFEIELFNWNVIQLSKDNGATMLMIKRCENEYDMPEEGMEVEVHVKGSHDGNVFEDRDVRFFISDAGSVGILPILENAIMKLKRGEIAEISLSPAYGFGESGDAKLKIPANASLKYEVELKWLEEQADPTTMDPNQKLEHAQARKNRGTEFFKAAKLKLAIKHYIDIADVLDKTDDFSDEQKKSADELLLAGRLNEAACYLKLDDFEAVFTACDKALRIDPNSVKAMYRIAQAQIGIKEYLSAYQGLQELLKLEPENKAAKQLSTRALQLYNAEKAKEKKRYNNMFKKFAEEDARKKASEETKQAEEVSEDTTTSSQKDEENNKAQPMETAETVES